MIRAKKSLGQNFLNSKAIARDIVRAAELLPTDTVVEIGPGKGFLTTELLASGARVIAVEKDDRMIPILEEKFAGAITEGRFILIYGDILRLEVRPPTADLQPYYKIVANIPYYITGQILRAFLGAEEKPERMILMLQKEVAERIVARDKKESILSLSVKAYGAPRIIKKVPARYFTPSPKVDSAILAIEDISGKHFKDRTAEERFFEIVKAGFAHKRKQLVGNLEEMFGDQINMDTACPYLFGDKTATLLAQAGIAPNARAEDVTLEQWLKLANVHRG